MDMHIEWDDPDAIDIEIDEVAKETDLNVLSHWYSSALEVIEEIKDRLTFAKEFGEPESSWVWRAGMKIAYLKKGARFIEQRMLKLGGMPPYPLNDGRAKHIRNLEAKLNKAKAMLADNGLDLTPLVRAA